MALGEEVTRPVVGNCSVPGGGVLLQLAAGRVATIDEVVLVEGLLAWPRFTVVTLVRCCFDDTSRWTYS